MQVALRFPALHTQKTTALLKALHERRDAPQGKLNHQLLSPTHHPAPLQKAPNDSTQCRTTTVQPTSHAPTRPTRARQVICPIPSPHPAPLNMLRICGALRAAPNSDAAPDLLHRHTDKPRTSVTGRRKRGQWRRGSRRRSRLTPASVPSRPPPPLQRRTDASVPSGPPPPPQRRTDANSCLSAATPSGAEHPASTP
jgi:hypothetical protein